MYVHKSLSNINILQKWDVSNVWGFSEMFYYCSSLSDINSLQNWNVCNRLILVLYSKGVLYQI